VAGPDGHFGEAVEEAAHDLLAAGGGPLAEAGLEAGEPAGVGAAADLKNEARVLRVPKRIIEQKERIS